MKTVLITGGSSGIGYAFAQYYAQNGYHVLIVSDNEEALIQAAQKLNYQATIKVEAIVCNLSQPQAVNQLLEQLQQRAFEIEILVNAAGFGCKGILHNTPLVRLQEMMNVHMNACFELTYRLLKPMLQNHHGTIINIASVSAYNPAPYNAVYAACKSFVLSFTLAIAHEYQNSGVQILALCPMATKTPFFKEVPAWHFMRKPEQVVNTAMLALKHHKS